MRIEDNRIIFRKNHDKTLIEDDDLGIFLYDDSLDNFRNLDIPGFRLSNCSSDGTILILRSKELLVKGNANRKTLKIVNAISGSTLFSTEKYYHYESIIDAKDKVHLMTYWNGLCVLDLYDGTELFKKDRFGPSLYNSDHHHRLNTVFIPTEKKSILTFDFNKMSLQEIKMSNISPTTWIKFDHLQERMLISDKKDALHCFQYNSLTKPLWTIDFSKFGDDGRINCFDIFITEIGLGAVQGFTPNDDQTPWASGIFWIFDLSNGNIVNRYEYSNFNQMVICDYLTDCVILDDLSAFSLTNMKRLETKYSEVLK